MYPTFSPAYNCCPSPSPPPHPSSASGRSLAWSPAAAQKLSQPVFLKKIFLFWGQEKESTYPSSEIITTCVLFFRNSWKRFEAKKRKVLLHVLECKAWLKRPRSQNGFWHRHNCSIAKKLLDSKTSSSKVSNKEKKTYNHCKTSHISLILGRRKSFHLVIYIRIWQLRTITGLQV